MRGLRQREWATFPLQYPDPEDVFYGYAPRGDTQALVLGAGWAGTAILALKAGQYVAKKSDWIDLYERYIGDEWTAFQAEIYRSCKQQWGYRIPEAPLERGRLKELCRQALAFENHYLAIYRDYLLAELHSDSDDHKLVAVRRLGQIVYPDEEVRDVLRTAAASPNEGLRHAAQATFERVQALFATAR